ncbi:MAG: hypothetical protein RLZ98_2439 [Pseudomonadota bacterium]
MRFLSRAVTGLALAIVTIAAVAFGGWRLYASLTADEGAARPGSKERSYTVDAGVLTPRTVKPVLVAFGQVNAWTMLDLRAATTGPLTALSSNFRDGRLVKQGEVLFTIDPENAERRVVDAKAALAQAKSALAEAKASVAHLRSELASAEAQLLVQKRDLERKRQLLDKKVTTEALVDQALLSVKAGEQVVIAKQNGLSAGLARIEQSVAAVERAELVLKDAQRALNDSTMKAPFSGRLTAVSVTLGRRVAQNEKLGSLIDPRSLEVSFPVRNDSYARLVNPANPSVLLKLPVKVKLALGTRVAVIEGRLDRSSAVVSANQAGRIVYARLIDAERSPLKPGDFVTIEVEEPEIDNVAVIPALAATVDGEILVIGPGNRLETVNARVLRFQGDDLIVDQVPFGAKYIRRRMPFLAPGVLVEPQLPASLRQQAATGGKSGRFVKLTHDHRDKLRGLLESSTGLSQAQKDSIRAMLLRSEATEEVIEQLESLRAEEGTQRQRS